MAPLPAEPPSSCCCWPVGVEVHLQRGALGGTEQGCSARHPGGCLGCISGLRGVSGGEECWRLGVLVSLHLSWPYLRSLCRTKRRRGARGTRQGPAPSAGASRFRRAAHLLGHRFFLCPPRP